jgi:hypothetical protein
VIVADDQGDSVSARWLEANAPAHQVLRKGLMSIGAEVEASASGSAAEGPFPLRLPRDAAELVMLLRSSAEDIFFVDFFL